MLKFKKWEISSFDKYREISQKYNVSTLAAKVAAARLESISEKELFSHSDTIFSPFDIKDMDRAVDRINEAIDNQERITVYGDYDADGITATVILYSYLEAMGADISYYIPQREGEGYGLNNSAIDKLKENGCELIITVDNGIAAVEEIKYAKSIGVDVLVTDHHMPQQTLPDCIVVDPHREDCPSKFKDICGAFVAFKLVAALDSGDYDSAFEQYGELVAIATLADVMPLVSENRTIVRLGIKKIENTDNLGLSMLRDAVYSNETKIDSTSVSFGIVPRINASGRMGDASRAVELLLTEDEDRANELCEEICLENDRRKSTEQDILDEIKENFDFDEGAFSQRVIIISGKGWHHGVLGIVASRLVEKTGKPTIVFSDDGEVLTGSGRSVEGFELFDAVCDSRDLFVRYGGHSLAVGISIKPENFDEFRRRINIYAKEHYDYMPQKCVKADAVLSPEEIAVASVKELEMFEPFGKDNPSPVFSVKGANITAAHSIGNGKHSRISLKYGEYSFNAVYFGKTSEELSCFINKNVDILFKLKINFYGGVESVSIQISDLRPSGINDDIFFKEKELFEIAYNSEKISKKQAEYILPNREEAVNVYKALKRVNEYNNGLDIMWWQLGGKINRAKLAVIIDAFKENGLIKKENDVISVMNNAKKTDLFDCKILKHILDCTRF